MKLKQPARREILNANALNFSGGPGALPQSVLEATRDSILSVPEAGLSVLGISHRSKWFREVLDEAESNIRELLNVPTGYSVLFLQGGSSLQFSIFPLSFGSPRKPAAYVASGYWSAKALHEAQRLSTASAVWDGKAEGYTTLPCLSELSIDRERNAFLHFVSNETVEGLQFAPLQERFELQVICDMSSDFLAQPITVSNYDLIYAHSQKNLGPAGVTVVVVSQEMLDKIPDGLPSMLDYRIHQKHRSNYNTPPVFAIYVLLLVTRWMLREIGGVAEMCAINRRKADLLYQTLARLEPFAAVHAAPACRSMMNAAILLREPEQISEFLSAAADQGFSGLEGHRSLGGLRVSLYNAVTESATEALCSFMEDFFLRRSPS
jgi:phosphoserine aminotransferase